MGVAPEQAQPDQNSKDDNVSQPTKPRPLTRDAITYSLTDAARLSGLSPSTIRRRAADGALRLVRVGRRTLVCGDSLRRLLAVGTEN